MIPKIEKVGLQLRFILLIAFILASIIFALCYSCDECDRKTSTGILALWPPDLVPHPPHFPQPQPRPGEPTPALLIKEYSKNSC